MDQNQKIKTPLVHAENAAEDQDKIPEHPLIEKSSNI